MDSRDQLRRSRRRAGARKWWPRVLAGLAVAGIIALTAFYFAAPWLGRRFNDFFEDLIGSTLNIPVVIESVQTSPFSQLTLTRLRSVSAAESGKIEFAAREISFYYDPVELLDGRLQRLVLAGPKMFLNLDSDLEGVAQVPDVPPPSGPGMRATVSRPESTGDYLPFSIAETVIESGIVLLGFEGRTLELRDLKLSLLELGRAHGQSFQLDTRAFGARITARGTVDLTVEDGRILPRYDFRGASVRVEGLELRRCIEWLRSADVPDDGIREDRIREDGIREDAARDERAPETVTAVLLDLLATGSGQVTLEGTLDGTWPERVVLELRSITTDLAAEYGPSIGVSAGEARLRITVIALGPFEKLSFDLEAEATGRLRSDTSLTNEAVKVTAKGEYVRRDGGTLQLDDFEVDFRDTGRLELQGGIAPLEGDASPQVNLMVNALALDARRLLSLRLLELPRGMPVTLAGDVDMRLRARGPVDLPRLDGTMTLPLVFSSAHDEATSVPATVAAELEGLQIDPWKLDARLETVLLKADSIDLAAALSLLPLRRGLDRLGISLNDARMSAALEGKGLEWSSRGLSGPVRVSAVASGFDITSEDLWIEATAVHTSVSLETRLDPAGDELPLELAVDLKLDEFLVGDVQASLEGEVNQLRARGTWTAGDTGVLEKLALDELTIETPLSGLVGGEGHLVRVPGPQPMELRLRLRAANVPTSRAFRTLVREPLEDSAPIMATLELDGVTAIDLEVLGGLDALRTSGRWNLSGGAFKAGALTLDGLQLDAPFVVGGGGSNPAAPASKGHLSIARVATRSFTIRDLELPFLHEERRYRLREPIALPVFGGTLGLRTLAFALSADNGPSLEIAGHVANLDLLKLTTAYGWIPLEGQVDAVFQPARYHGGRIEWNGSLDVKAFGGRLRSTDFTIDDLFQPYLSFELRRGIIENVRLEELGSKFNFGLISGVARGRVDDLEIVGSDLTSFRIDFETVPVPGVPRYVNRRAIKSLRRILEGPFGDIEETLFSRFDYDQFGFNAELDDGTFKLRGKYTEGDHEYLMLARWYQFPRISIINASPGQAYDWDLIMESLREIYSRTGGDTPEKE